MYIVIAILLFGMLIAVHELGHFIAAKKLGVQVNEFSIGMGPALWKKQKGETLYALRAFPIGGYCAMEGEDEETENPRCFSVQPWWKKLIVLVAGSAMNFLFGLLLLIAIFFNTFFPKPTLAGFMEGCPYEGESALAAGDTFYKIDGHRIYFTDNVSLFLSRGGETHDIVVIRDGHKVELEDMTITRRSYEGYQSPMFGFMFTPPAQGVLPGLKYSLLSSVEFVREVWLALTDLVSGAVGIDQMAGIVGVVDMVNQVGQEAEAAGGFLTALINVGYFGAFVAVNLAVMNLLPLPALDGGRIFFILVNALIGVFSKKRIPAKYEGYVHAAGMVLLLGLMAFVMYNDIARMIVR